MSAPATSDVAWTPVLADDLAGTATYIARDVSERLRNPQVVERAAALALEQTAFPRSIHWMPYTLAQGYAGLALLSAYLDDCFEDDGWDLTGREQLEFAVRDAERIGSPPTGLFSGLSGLAFAAWQLSRNGTRYVRLLQTLDDRVSSDAIDLSRNLCDQQRGLTVGDFDAISGLAGIGAYLLCRRSYDRAEEALTAVLESLAQMVLDGNGLPLWHTPAHLLWDEGMKKTYPFGNLNCGLAHGIPGPLALMSLAQLEGVRVRRMPEAIAQVSEWLSHHRHDDEWGVNWSTAVPVNQVARQDGLTLEAAGPGSGPDGPSRYAWCYGSPGVARALWLAGRALDSAEQRTLALSAMHAIFRRPVPVRRIDSPTYCHGVAGLLSIALRFVHESGDPILLEESRALVRQIVSHYAPDSLLGFRNIEIADNAIDQPGLLDGAPGVALVLLAAARGVEPTWDRIFLLS